jgi:hypothetical protein
MVQKEQWQLAGGAPDVYERCLVPALFGPWDRYSLTPPPSGAAIVS